MGVLFFIIIMAVIVGAIVAGSARNKRLIEEGKIIDRGTGFYENAETFTTSATYDEIEKSVRGTSFSDCSVDILYYPDSKSILFKSSHAWNATIKYAGTQNGKNVFQFSFPTWRTHKGVPYRIDTMNMMETSIEKIFLSIDPQTTVVSQKQKYKTKF